MDSVLKTLLGGDNDDDHNQRRSQAQDFVSRYETGDPTEGFTDEEAAQRYEQVAGQLSPEEYQEAAMHAFERMSPDQRREFAEMIARHGDVSGMPIDSDIQYDDPRQLAQMTSQFHQQPSGLGALLGGGGGFGGGYPMGGGGLGGMLGGLTGGQMGASRMGGIGGMGGMMNNPVARAAIGGIAAMAFKQILGRR